MPSPMYRREDAEGRIMMVVLSGPAGRVWVTRRCACQKLSTSTGFVSRHPGWGTTNTWASIAHTCGRGAGSEIPAADQAEPEDAFDQLDALLVLRKVLDLELLEQQAQLGLHGVDAEEQLVGDLLVGGRGGVRVVVLVRPAQRRDDLPLRRRQRGGGDQLLPHLGQLRRPPAGVPEAERRRSEHEGVAVPQPAPAG